MKRVQFSVTYPDRLLAPLHRRLVAATGVSRAELLVWSPAGAPRELFWFDGDRAAAETLVSAVGSVVEREFVEGDDGTYAVVRQSAFEFPEPILEVVADAGVVFVPPVVFLESGRIEFEAVGETAAVSDLHDAVSELGDLAIERVHEFERRGSPTPVTDRQRAALDAAVAAGYYRVPREGTVEDVADALDCATSTAGELLRKAEAAVIREYAERR